MPAPTLIGLMGLKQSGKDTFANRLVTAHGFTRFALADPMREFALALDPIVFTLPRYKVRLSELVNTHGWEGAKNYPEVRRTLQRLGTEAGRGTFGEDFWVNITDAKVNDRYPAPVVITDIRFPNEYAWIKRRGGVLIRILRPGQTSTDPHPSEALAEDFENYPALAVVNDGGIADLHDTADALVNGGAEIASELTLF